MKAIKKINNNVAICVDNNKKELIAFGKGIGFPAMPYEIQDLSQITMTFYRIDRRFYKLLEDIPEEVFAISTQIVAKARQTLQCDLNPNLVVGLADHINFAKTRMENYSHMKMYFSYDIEQLYPKETELGRYAVNLIHQKLRIKLPEGEITNIAMHFIDAESEHVVEPGDVNIDILINEITNQIEDYFSIKLKRDDFSYNRFAMHMRYFLKRIQDGKQFADGNEALFLAMREDNAKIYECAQIVMTYISDKMQTKSTEDEMLYLMIHIHRMLNNSI